LSNSATAKHRRCATVKATSAHFSLDPETVFRDALLPERLGRTRLSGGYAPLHHRLKSGRASGAATLRFSLTVKYNVRFFYPLK
jgi:hypothetical protein